MFKGLIFAAAISVTTATMALADPVKLQLGHAVFEQHPAVGPDLGGQRLFRYRNGEEISNLTDRKLNEYIQEHMGDEFSAKDFRTWGGTLTAAIMCAERGPCESATESKRAVAAVMRSVGEKLGNTAAVARSSYVSPAVVDHYLDGRTIDDFRPRHLRVVGARDRGLDPEERALLSLLRSARIRQSRAAA
jgi:DNA topoisomerase I